MPQDKPIQVVAIEWQRSSNNNSYIGGIRLVLSNGQKSPAFFAYSQYEQNMARCDLNFNVKRMNGSAVNYYICQLNFFNADNSKSTSINSGAGGGLAADC